MAHKRKQICWIITTVCFIMILIFISIDFSGKPNAVPYKQTAGTGWTVLVIVNNGFLDFFQNWYHYYRKLKLDSELIVMAEDVVVFYKLRQLAGNKKFTVERGRREVPSIAVVYGSGYFKEVVSGKPRYILRYLKNGVNIVYADIDAVWLRNPFPYFIGYFDIWMQIDGPGNLCTGLIAIHGNNETITLMQNWKSSLARQLQIDQTAFNEEVKLSRARLKVLNTSLFPSGRLYFDEFNDEQRTKAVIVHNNFIKGHTDKLQRFQKYELWFS